MYIHFSNIGKFALAFITICSYKLVACQTTSTSVKGTNDTIAGLSSSLVSLSAVSEYLMEEMYFFAKLSSLAYCLFTDGWSSTNAGCPLYCNDDTTFENVTLYKVWKPNESLSAGVATLFYIDHGRKANIINFRGSTTFNNWIVDISLGMTNYEPISIKKGIISNMNSREYEGCKVHSGFYEAAEQTWDIVNKTIDAMCSNFSDYKTIVIGHSLGGAVSQLIGIELDLLGYRPLILSWGSPRVGNTKFVNYLDGMFDPNISYSKIQEGILFGNIRHEHKGDIVPYTPPPSYQHGGLKIYINKVDTSPSSSEIIVYSPHYKRNSSYLSQVIKVVKSLMKLGEEYEDASFIEVTRNAHRNYYINQGACSIRNKTFSDSIGVLFSTVLDIPFAVSTKKIKRNLIDNCIETSYKFDIPLNSNITINILEKLPNKEAFELIKRNIEQQKGSRYDLKILQL